MLVGEHERPAFEMADLDVDTSLKKSFLAVEIAMVFSESTTLEIGGTRPGLTTFFQILAHTIPQQSWHDQKVLRRVDRGTPVYFGGFGLPALEYC